MTRTAHAETRETEAERTVRRTVTVLRDRAESYWNDSRVLAADGDAPMAVAYKTIAAELRLCADILATERNP